MRVMNRLKKRIPVFLCVLCVLCGESQLRAQKHLVLDLNRTISLANDSSLESFRTQNMYLSGYWEYRTFRANRLPSLTLDVTPAQYNRDITKRYDSGQDLDVYRTQQSYYAYGGLSVKQNFDSKVDRSAEDSVKVGDIGISTTRLAQIGYAEINGKIVEVKSIDGFLNEKTPIIVSRITDGTIMVEKHKE